MMFNKKYDTRVKWTYDDDPFNHRLEQFIGSFVDNQAKFFIRNSRATDISALDTLEKREKKNYIRKDINLEPKQWK